MAVKYYASRQLKVGVGKGDKSKIEIRDIGDEIPEAATWNDNALTALISDGSIIPLDSSQKIKKVRPDLFATATGTSTTSKDKEKEKSEEVKEAALYDPNDHTARAVIDFVNDNPDELETVLELEASSESPRKTLISALEKMLSD